MKDHIDARLFEQIDAASEDEEVEAIVMMSQDLAAAEELDERGVGGRVMDHVIEQVHQEPSQIRFLPKLGAVYVKGSGRLIRQLLEEDEVISATSSESTFTLG